MRVLLTGVGCPGAHALISNLKLQDESIFILGTNANEQAIGRWLCDDFAVVPWAYEENYVDERMRGYALPKKLLDSMAYKVPVIVGPYEARQKIVERYECGLVTEDWADALTTLANDKDLRKKMGENGYKAFKMNYSWELQEKKMLEVYDELLKEEGQ